MNPVTVGEKLLVFRFDECNRDVTPTIAAICIARFAWTRKLPREFRVDTHLISVHTPRPVAGADFAARSWSSFLIDLRFCTDSRGISNNLEQFAVVAVV